MQPSTLVYRSSWSPITPLVYSDDTHDEAVNKLIDSIFRHFKTKRLFVKNNKMYYCPSDDYKRVVRLRKIK
jgi:hypothetical protein